MNNKLKEPERINEMLDIDDVPIINSLHDEHKAYLAQEKEKWGEREKELKNRIIIQKNIIACRDPIVEILDKEKKELEENYNIQLDNISHGVKEIKELYAMFPDNTPKAIQELIPIAEQFLQEKKKWKEREKEHETYKAKINKAIEDAKSGILHETPTISDTLNRRVRSSVEYWFNKILKATGE